MRGCSAHVVREKVENGFALAVRRASLFLLVAALGACVAAPGQAPMRGVRTAQLPAGATPSLTGNDAIIVGVAVTARHFPQTSPGTPISMRRSYIFADEAGAQYAVPLTPVDGTIPMRDEAGARLWLMPFAMQVPAGRYQVQGRAMFHATGQFGGWDLITTPTGSFEAVAGRVTYVGGFGELTQELRFPDEASRDAACRALFRGYALLPGYNCHRSWWPFLRQDETGDLALIRAAFPALADVPVVARPATPGAGVASWPDVLDPLR